MRALAGLLLFVLLALVAGMGPALAHPHIFVDSTARIIFRRRRALCRHREPLGL